MMPDDSVSQAWDEAERLETLRNLRIMDSDPEPAFDHIVALAQRLFDVPIALVSLVDDHRQWFKAKCGLAVDETERSASFCAHALDRQDSILVVPDARADDRFVHNRLVTGPPHIRFYAGAVLRAPNGAPIGTVCIIDDKPRDGLDGHGRETLRMLADLAADELELREAKLEMESHVREVDDANRRLSEVLDLHRADLDRAALSQSLILPRPHRELYGMTATSMLIPSAVVSGDAFSYGQLSPTMNFFWLADVAGHGVSAALLAATLSRVITAELLLESGTQSPRPPAEVLRRLNEQLSLWDHDDSYFTMLYGIADGAGHASIAVAGHPPPIVCEPGRLARVEEVSGTPIGLFEKIDVETIEIDLPQGARMLLYSDGVEEVESGAGEPFGSRRLQAWLFESQSESPQAALVALEARLRGWGGNGASLHRGLSDDATAILLDFAATENGRTAGDVRP